METLEVIHKRASLKLRLIPRPVEQEKIVKILKAGQVAPSARNKQPWRFIIVEDKKTIDEVVSKSFSDVNQPFKNAPVLIFACAAPSDDIIRDGKEYYLFDVGLAMENMVLAATDMGLASHLMTGFEESVIKNILGIPEETRVVACTPISYPEGDNYDAAAQEKLGERTRKSLKEICYHERWNKAYKW